MSRPLIPSLSLSNRFAWLQAPLGGLGFIVWLVSIQSVEWARKNGYIELMNVAAGYWMGFGTAIAGWVFVHMWNGHWGRFVEPDGFGRWISIITTGVIFLFGLGGLFIDLYANTDGWFNTAYWFGMAVVGLCLAPVIDAADGVA